MFRTSNIGLRRTFVDIGINRAPNRSGRAVGRCSVIRAICHSPQSNGQSSTSSCLVGFSSRQPSPYTDRQGPYTAKARPFIELIELRERCRRSMRKFFNQGDKTVFGYAAAPRRYVRAGCKKSELGGRTEGTCGQFPVFDASCQSVMTACTTACVRTFVWSGVHLPTTMSYIEVQLRPT